MCTTGSNNATGGEKKSVSPVNSWNEWDPLEEIIVGIPEYATVPRLLPEVQVCVAKANWEFFDRNAGKYWADVIPREHWDLLCKQIAEFVRVLELEGVKVVRPEPVDHGKSYSILGFQSQGFYSAMPRDFLLVVGDELIEATMTWRSRYFEYLSYRPLILDYWKRGAKWTVAPKPTDFEKLINKVTNLAGIEWVRRHLEPRGIRVHQLTFDDPRPMHIDATFGLVKPGVALQNPDRPCHQTETLKSAGWDVINVPQPLISKDHPLWLGSNWLSMNVLMLDPNRVMVEKEEVGIQEMYRKIGVTPIPVTIRYANSIGGGFHCWTSDVRRRGGLECYFDWTRSGFPKTSK
ncbi:Glycine amidinotransferase mitochondrial [Fasciolopsis buskii]|uniref:Glycine amidinotransferase n=1 Tax=Fasciolopsis buskii TaxID=27845 RepID=A0A8E0VKH7_9TREM|nr:Glycine amidinotransferase mitochondrial [Fasciolopsis buski]